MDNTERQVIDDLFAKLRQVENQTAPRDEEAEARIRGHLARQPAAPYYMAQAIVMQEQALAAAQARIAEMEEELQARPAGGGFLGGLFGTAATPAARGRSSAAAPDPRIAAYAKGAPGAGQQAGGSGFLAGAMQTAIGVAGGVMLANALGGLFTADDAAAAEPGPEDPFSGVEDTPEDADFGPDDGDFGGLDDF